MLNNNKWPAVPVLLFLFCSSPVMGADGYHELYQLARKNDSEVVRAEARLSSVKAESDIVRSNLLPRLDANVGVSHVTQTTDNYNNASRTGSVLGHNYGVSARLNVLSLPTIMNLRAADAGIKSEEAAVKGARQDLIIRFSDAYLGLLRAQLDKQVAEKELERVKQVLDQSQAFLKAGTSDIIAVYEAQARYDGVQAELNRFESNLSLAVQKISMLVGRSVDVVQEDLPFVTSGPDPENIEWWLKTMEREDPYLQQSLSVMNRYAIEYKATKFEHLPSVQASGSYTSSKGSAFLPEVETSQWYAGLNVSIPIFSGGETTARVKRALANEREKKGAFDSIRKMREENLKQAYYNLLHNVQLINALKQKLSSSELQLKAVSKGRSIGTRTAIDLLNAEQAYSVSLRDYRSALYDNVFRKLMLKSAAGVLDEEAMFDTATALAGKTEPVKLDKQPASLPILDEQKIVGFGTGVVIGGLGRQGVKFHTSPDGKGAVLSACPNGDMPPVLTGNTWVVQDKKDNWLKISCGPAVTSVWVEMQQGFKYLAWKEYLKNRKVRLLKGLPSDSYRVLDSKGTEVKKILAPEEVIDVAGVVENWVLVKTAPTEIGWLLWRDKQGRMLIRIAE